LGLESVTIGNSITLIDTRAFWECTNLKSVIIGNSVTSIGTDAFEDCTNLETVVLGNSVETIGDRAFYNCQKLQSINFPESVRVIMFSSFYGCTSFESVVIPDTVETLEAYVFNDCTNLESAEIHANITSLEDGLFRGCTSLTSVTIPDTVTSFGDDTFHNCTSLASITIPDNVTSIGSYTFCGCTSLTSVTIPDSVTSIGEYTFNGCTNLASINLPKAITSLSNSLFWGCTSLTSITIPASVTSIGSYAFYDCTSLTSIYFKGDAPTFERNALPDTEIITLHYSDKKNWTVTGGKFWANEYDFNCYNAVADMPAVIFNSNGGTDVPLQVLMHGEKAVRPTNPTKEGHTFVAWYRDADFNTLWDFDNDTIGDTDITLYAMWMLSDEVFAVGGITYRLLSDDTVQVGNGLTPALADCGKSIIVIPETVTFNGITYAVTAIGDYAFQNCDTLTEVYLPESVISIGKYAFQDSNELTIITLPDNLTTIGDYAFQDCSALTGALYLPASMTYIGINAIQRTLLQIVSFVDGINLKEIPNSAFRGCTSLTTVRIPDSVTRIGDWAFSGCSALTSINIPDGVTYIGASAFKSCVALKSITIPVSVTSIGSEAFGSTTGYGTIGLETVIFLGPKPTFGGNIFNNVSNLNTIYVPWEDTTIPGIPSYIIKTMSVTMTIKENPDKTIYTVDEFLNLDGLEITLTWTETDTDNVVATKDVTIADFAINGATVSPDVNTPLTADNSKVTITFTATGISEEIDITVNKLDGPEAPEITGTTTFNTEDNTYTYTISPAEGLEYRLGGGEWTDSNIFDGLTPGSTYTFYIRYKETSTHKAGAERSKSVEIPKLLNNANPSLNYTVSGASGNRTITIVRVDGAEYSFDGINYSDENVLTGTNNAIVTVYIRYKETATHVASEAASATVNTAKMAQTLTFTVTEVNKTYGDDDFTMTASCEVEGEFTITYESSDTLIATVDNDGKVTILRAGEVTITAYVAETEEYEAATASYVLKIAKKVIEIPAADTREFTYNGTAQTYNIAESDYYTVTGNQKQMPATTP